MNITRHVSLHPPPSGPSLYIIIIYTEHQNTIIDKKTVYKFTKFKINWLSHQNIKWQINIFSKPIKKVYKTLLIVYEYYRTVFIRLYCIRYYVCILRLNLYITTKKSIPMAEELIKQLNVQAPKPNYLTVFNNLFIFLAQKVLRNLPEYRNCKPCEQSGYHHIM